MMQYQPTYQDHQNLPNQDEPMIDASEIQNTVNWQNRSVQQQAQRGRSTSRMPSRPATHQHQHNGSVNGGSSINDPISLSSEESPERRSRKRAASRAPISNRSPKKTYRAGSVFNGPGHSPGDKIKIEYQNQVKMRDANMHRPHSPIRYRNGVPVRGSRPPQTPGRQHPPEVEARLQELQRQKGNLFSETMSMHKEQFNSIMAEEEQLLMQSGGSQNNSVSNGGYGSPNGMALPSPTRNGFNNSPLGKHGPHFPPGVANGNVNGNHAPMPSSSFAMNGLGNYPQRAYDVQNSPQNGSPRSQQNGPSPQPKLQPAIWDSSGNITPKKHFVDSIRESAWKEKENHRPMNSNIPNLYARGQSVAPPSQPKMTPGRGKSVGPSIYRSVEGDSRKVNMQTGQWASSSEDDDPPPLPLTPTTSRFQRSQTVAPNGPPNYGNNHFVNGAHVQGADSRSFNRSRTVAPEPRSTQANQGNNNFGNGIQVEGTHARSFPFQRSNTVAPEPITPQRMAGTQHSQHSHATSSNFVTPPEFPQTQGPFSFFQQTPNRKIYKAEPITPPNKTEVPYPTSESGSLLEHMHRSRLRMRNMNGVPQAEQYANDVPKGGISFKARKKEPVTPMQQHVIDLISPDGSETRRLPILTFPEPPIIEKPMKERIAPASKAGARKRGKSQAPEEVDPIVVEQKRQERAATMILEKERKAAEGSIFGDDPVEEEKKKAEERKRLEQKRKERQLAAQHEQESRELEQRKLVAAQQERAEQAKLQKQLEESRNQIRRAEVRKEAEKEEAKAREERRKAAQARIEADRKKKEEAKQEAEKKRQKENDVQVLENLVEAQKSRQEALKKQLSSIHASKISSDDSSIICLGDNNTAQAGEKNGEFSKGKEREVTNDKEQPTTNGPNGINGDASKDVIDSESNALFVAANVPPSHDGTEAVTTASAKAKQPLLFDRSGFKNVYGLDIRAILGKSKGPTTAAELMALAQGQNAKTDSFMDIREKERDAQRTKERLQSRMARREREKSAPPPVLPRRPEPKTARASASQPEPKQAKQPARPRTAKVTGKGIEKRISSALFPAYIPENFAEPSPPVNKVTAVVPKEPSQPNAVAKPGLVLLSDEERVRLEAEQKRKEALEHEKQIAAKASASGERRKERLRKEAEDRTARAREKKKQQLIQDATNRGVKLPLVEVLSQLETFMEERERRRRKAALTKETINKIKNFSADSLANELEEDLDLNASPSQAKRSEDLEDAEGDSPETLERKARQRAIRETLNSMSQGRKLQQTRTVRMTCAKESDSDSSDASEEDPDPFTPQESDTSDSDDDDDDDAITSHGARPDADEFATQIEEPVTRAQPKKKNRKVKPVMTCPDDPENCVKVYTIMERKIVNGVFHTPYTRQSFFNYDESVDEIKAMVSRQKEARPISCEEAWEGDMFQATLTFDLEGDNILEIWLTQHFKSRDMNPADFNMNEIKQLRHTEKSYFVKRTIITCTTNEETGVVKEVVDVQHINHWSDIDLANNNARDLLVQYTKPPRPVIKHFAIYDDELVPQLRKMRDDLHYLDCFSVELSRGEGEGLELLEWIPKEIISVSFETELYRMKGPLN